ncbi:MAG: hypothetical protein JW821_19455 [Deltaproteobacteria bacterium]|nr:hypothetical protein [Deltaproteobacteria bacterium]
MKKMCVLVPLLLLAFPVLSRVREGFEKDIIETSEGSLEITLMICFLMVFAEC